MTKVWRTILLFSVKKHLPSGILLPDIAEKEGAGGGGAGGGGGRRKLHSTVCSTVHNKGLFSSILSKTDSVFPLFTVLI
jgi:hypothetical protein